LRARPARPGPRQEEDARGRAGRGVLAGGAEQQARERDAHLPAAAELAAQLAPVALLKAQAGQHVGDALVRVVAAGRVELVLGGLQQVRRARVACGRTCA